MAENNSNLHKDMDFQRHALNANVKLAIHCTVCVSKLWFRWRMSSTVIPLIQKTGQALQNPNENYMYSSGILRII